MVVAFRAPEGDFRDWAEVKGWASGIADALGELADHRAAGDVDR
jgi:hypothetical protein